ncbi:MAG: hypothetical protein SFW62_10340 [Alphaproteobacteria bacterium]|nr:hypothetical protein [Alphaproteobacteria bacterium]
MRRILSYTGMFLLLAALSVWVSPAHASSGSSESKKEVKKEGGEGKHGGGKTDEGEEGDAKKGDSVSGGRFAGDPIYVRLPVLILPIISETGVQQLVTMQIVIEVKDFGVGDDVHSNIPRVMDSLMRALYGGLGQGSLRNGYMLDVNKVKAKATAAIQEVVGAGNVRRVLLENVSQRML